MEEGKTIRALTRGLEVFEVLCRQSSTSLAELHQTTKLSKATLLRILKTLQQQGWVYRTMGDDKYRACIGKQQLEKINRAENKLIAQVSPIMVELSDQVGWPSDLAVRDGVKMKIIESTRLRSRLSVNKHVVGFCPHFLWSALGRVYLAYCPDDERLSILGRLKDSGDSFDQISQSDVWISRLLDNIRERGYATREEGYWGHNVDFAWNVDAISVPVLATDHVHCCLNLLWIAGSVKQDEIEKTLFPALSAAAEKMSDSISQ